MNWSNSNSARRKTFCINAKSTPPPTVKPYSTCEFALKPVLMANDPQGCVVVQTPIVPEVYCVTRPVTDTLVFATLVAKPIKPYGRKLPATQPARSRKRGEVLLRDRAVAT